MHRLHWTLVFMLIALMVAIASTAITHTVQASSTVQTVLVPPVCNPEPGQGHLGVCTTQPADPNSRVSASQPPTLAGSPGYIPDVSSFQGAVDWNHAHSLGLNAAIVKAYEVNWHQDEQFARSWAQLRALHVWHAAYLFVRGGDCNSIADRYVSIIGSAGGWDSEAGPPILDMEVPSAFGMAPCLISRIQHDTGITTFVIYTAPGTWPGGSNANAPLWIATYGSGFGCIWTCHPVAWQYTDGLFGPAPHSVFGLGNGDVSVDFGLGKIWARPHNPPKPPVIHHYERFYGAPGFLIAGKRINERGTVVWWDHQKCTATKCPRMRADLVALRQRIAYVSTHPLVKGKATWNLFWRGWRFQEILRRSK